MVDGCTCILARFEDPPCPIHGPVPRCEACGSLMVSPTGESHTASHCIDYLRAALRAANRDAHEWQRRALAAEGAIDAARKAFISFEEAHERARRAYHNFQEWGDEQWDPITDARTEFFDALARRGAP